MFSLITILGWIPTSIYFGITAVGLIGLVIVSILPLIPKSWGLVFGLLFGVGSFLLGAVWTSGPIIEELNNMKEEMKLIEAEAEKVSNELAQEYEADSNRITSNGNKISEKVNELLNENDDAQCSIPDDVRLLHDSAIKNEVPDTTRSTDGGGEENGDDRGEEKLRLSELTTITVDNYTSCNEVRRQLQQLQRWVGEMQRVHNYGE
jgi:gas vesicle protein|tara:strand:- start:8856 stop:9473 length:618 start_codon:yes stop_codon:yes gene_type:complete